MNNVVNIKKKEEIDYTWDEYPLKRGWGESFKTASVILVLTAAAITATAIPWIVQYLITGGW